MATSPKNTNSAPSAKKTQVGFVTVACKLPQGLEIPVPGSKERIKLHGFNSPFAVAGHGMTEVKEDDWNAIEAHYSEFAWLKNESVFAMREKASAVDKAEDREGEAAGFEPIDPAKLPGKIEQAND